MSSEVERRLSLLGGDLVRLRNDAEVLWTLVKRVGIHVIVARDGDGGTRVEASDDFDESATRLDLVSNRDG